MIEQRSPFTIDHLLPAAGVAFSGLVAFAGMQLLLYAHLQPFKRMLAELGVALPAALELALSVRLDALGLLFALLGPAGALAAGALLSRKGARIVQGGLLLLSLPLPLLSMLVGVAVLALIETAFAPDRRAPDPGQAARVADDALTALRAGLANPRPVSEGDAGLPARWIAFAGPGASAPTGASYAQGRAAPPAPLQNGCLVLPWGPPDSTRSQEERFVTYPCDASALAISALRERGPPGGPLDDPATFGTADDGLLVPIFRHVFSAGEVNGRTYGYALMLRRARLGLGDVPIDARTPYSDRLLEVRVSVFEDFDPSAAPPAGGVVPTSNVPVHTLITLVAPEVRR